MDKRDNDILSVDELKEELSEKYGKEDDKGVIEAVRSYTSIAQKENELVLSQDSNSKEIFEKLIEHTNEAMQNDSLSEEAKLKIHDDLVKLAKEQQEQRDKKASEQIKSNERVKINSQNNTRRTVLGGMGITALIILGGLLIKNMSTKK